MLGGRGRTRPGRLARLDRWLLATEPLGPDDVVVDVGLGDTPDTTLELARAVAPANVVGVDHDPGRVARALAAGLDARVGGFELPVRARVVRVMNVLRGYPVAEVPSAHAALAAALVPGGVLIEGSSDPEGHVLTAHLVRRTADDVVREGLWLSTDFARGFAPRLFRDWLPRDLRRSPGPALQDLFARWTAAWASARAAGVDSPPAAFVASASALEDLDATHARDGHVVWRPTRGG